MKRILSILTTLLLSATAWAQSQLILTPQDEFVPKDADELYDRVTMQQSLSADEWAIISLPSKLDGYFFGADAKRLRIIYSKQSDALNYDIIAEEMTDEEDFLADQSYLIKPQFDIQEITCITAGLQTAVSKSGFRLQGETIDSYSEPQMCLVSMSPLGKFSYATAFIPFSVELSNGVSAYTVAGSGTTMLAHRLTTNAVPANTAVILRAPAKTTTAELTILHDAPKLSAADEALVSSNILQGSTADLQTQDGVLTLAGTSTGNPAFMTFTGNYLAANKAFLPASAAGGMMRSLSFDDGETTDIFLSDNADMEGTEELNLTSEKIDPNGITVTPSSRARIYIIGNKKVFDRK